MLVGTALGATGSLADPMLYLYDAKRNTVEAASKLAVAWFTTLQRSINLYAYGAKFTPIAVDAVIGPNTTAALKRIGQWLSLSMESVSSGAALQTYAASPTSLAKGVVGATQILMSEAGMRGFKLPAAPPPTAATPTPAPPNTPAIPAPPLPGQDIPPTPKKPTPWGWIVGGSVATAALLYAVTR